MNLNSPNLLLVGFQKCGSSSLFENLVKHPQILGSKPKETFFYSDPKFERYNIERNWNTTPDLFSKKFLPTSFSRCYRYVLEGSVSNFYQETALQYAMQSENIKVIFIIRDPLQRFVSNYKYAGTNGLYLKPGTSIEDYYKLIRENKMIDRELLRFGIEHGKYRKFIKVWEEAIGSNNVFITSLKKLSTPSNGEFGRIWSFLELEDSSDSTLVHKNKTQTVLYPRLHSFLVRFFGGYGLNKTFLFRIYSNLFTSDLSVEMPDWMRNELREVYKEEYKYYSDYF